VSLMPFGFNNKKVIAISCGMWHAMALTDDYRVWEWGMLVNKRVCVYVCVCVVCDVM